MVELRTPRLLLRRWRDADIAALARINADPEVMRFIGDGSVADHAATAAQIAGFEQTWQAYGFGRFAVELRGSGVLAGFTGMAIPSDVPEIMPCVEVGWRLGRAHWGRGLATEAARAALRFAFADCGLDRIVGVYVLGNDASARVMAKLGMRFDRDTTEILYGRPVRIHAISREEYATRSGGVGESVGGWS
ncbi:MAG: GNAT family N-acetyltransferase [Actinobacteria bacterium 13_2_20CM_2_71_6]|nr:MAG: GNAT family N-acetyltransferase [Actinobacteria bacterium 13_2_20CM_2_71_6]